MRPGEENLDGPPIHGNTRLEVIWTAIPAILLVGLCTYAFVVLEDVEAAEADPMNVRVVGEQFAWTFYYERDGKEVASRQLHLPIDRPVKFTLQSKDVLHDFWVPGLPHEEGRGAGDRRHLHASRRTGSAPTRSSAPSCAASGTRSCARPRRRGARSRSSTPGWPTLGKPAAAPDGGGGGGGGGARPTARRSSRPPRATAPPATRWPTRAPTARSGPDLDKVLADKDEAFIKRVDRGPGRRDRRRLPGRDHAAELRSDAAPAQIDALVKYLSEVTKGG